VTDDSRDCPAIQDQLSATVQEAQRGLGACADRVKSRVRNFAGQQKSGADQIGGIADAAEAAANDLQDQAPKAAEYGHDLASKIDAAAFALRELPASSRVPQAGGRDRCPTGPFPKS
jgi:hypothetical protein